LGGLTLSAAGVVVPNGWWLSGSIPSANCIGAYAAKGAATYAASKINLANPGTYNTVDGTAYPTWDDTNGWKFAGASSQYLDTGITPDNTYSTIIRFSNVTANATCVLFGAQSNLTDTYHIFASYSGGASYFRNGGSYAGTGATSGIYGIIGQNAAINGSIVSAIGTGAHAWSTLKVACMSTNYFLTGYVQAFATYNIALSAPQVLAVYNAMAAL